ncbi:MAG: phosphatase PAP2 family protein [Gemmatimonadetes bacterium]|nr:phosphatase PAP2 family protein [Gemmatimonadota bacterium]MBK9069289.1 phosphatase PAP2 family protein [Gemmatimonadota bacterium]MBK9692007.1 phosphatase PAP2 family protein [Gemmatimonadota bacterium]
MNPPAPLRPVDWLVLGYALFTALLALLRLPGYPAVGGVLVANALIVLLVALARHASPGPAGQVLRTVYPLLTLGAFYPAIDLLNHFGAIAVHDAAVRGWELALFGSELSRTWWEAYPSPFWSALLHAVYFAYYPIVLGPPLLFLAMGRAEAAERSVLWLMATFLTCYAVFLLYPVAGPYYEFPRPSPAFLDNGPARLVYRTLARGSAYGAAFPSSHVAATLVAAAAAWRGWRPLGAMLIPPAVLLTVGVVYCQMHYAVDALAGTGLALVLVLALGPISRAHGPERRDERT